MKPVELTTNQKQAIESIDTSMLVTAGAGSGKTLVLVRRFVEALQRDAKLSVNNLLAVTYTRKAAKEMRTRIKARLKELYEEASAQEAKRWHQCLSEMDSAYIDTIHSLCQSILLTFAIEMGLDPNIEVLDEIEKAQLMQESIEETFRQIIASNDRSISVLEHFPLEDVEGFLKIALKNHLQFTQIAASLENLSVSDSMAELDKLLTRTQRQLLVDLAIDEEWHKAGNYLKSNSYAEAGNKLDELRLQAAQIFEQIQIATSLFQESEEIESAKKEIKAAWQKLLDMSNIGAVRAGGNSEAAKEMRALVKTLIDKSKDTSQSSKKGYGLPVEIAAGAAEKDAEYWKLWQAVLRLARQTQDIYASKKTELGKLDFDDLIAKVSAVLKEPGSSIKQYYSTTLKHILVDEFQDTNPLQAEIISLLAGKNTKLFLIGDDKQSIYKFQGADVSTFNAWQRKSINALTFEHSFRSQASVVDFVNATFSIMLTDKSAHVDYRAKYSPLKAQRDALTDIEIVELPDADNQSSVLSNKEIEGRAVAKWIYNHVKGESQVFAQNGEKRAINYGDFAILTARNGDLPIFESCLSEFGIPYVTSGGRTFLERQEIYDLENMLLFLNNTSDNHALFAVLRCEMFSISDDLIHNTAMHGSDSFWQSMQGFAVKQSNGEISGYQLIAEAVLILKRLLAYLPVLTLRELTYKIIRDTNYDLLVLTLPDGKQRYKNIWKFYDSIKDDLSPTQYVEHLELSRQLKVSETNAPVDSQQSVKLMTIHAAKGLEFPAVALPALSTSFNLKKSKLLFHRQYGIVLNTSRTEQESESGIPLPYQLGKTLDDDMDIAEKKRLLYVAMTRARDHLALFIKEGNDNKNSIANWLRPLLTENSSAKFTIHNADLEPVLSENTADSKTDQSKQLFSSDSNDRVEYLFGASRYPFRNKAPASARKLPFRLSPQSASFKNSQPTG